MTTTNGEVGTTYAVLVTSTRHNTEVDLQPLDEDIEIAIMPTGSTPADALLGFQLSQLAIHNFILRENTKIWAKCVTGSNDIVILQK